MKQDSVIKLLMSPINLLILLSERIKLINQWRLNIKVKMNSKDN